MVHLLFMNKRMNNKYIIAIDDFTSTKVIKSFVDLGVTHFKIGEHLFYKHQTQIIRNIYSVSGRIFVDCKLNNTPKSMEKSKEYILDQGVYGCGADFLTVHLNALDSLDVDNWEKGKGVLAVIKLSTEAVEGENIYNSNYVDSTFEKYPYIQGAIVNATLLDSPHKLDYKNKMLVAVGVREEEDNNTSHKRTISAKKAFKQGATHVVIGSEVMASDDPIKTFKEFYIE